MRELVEMLHEGGYSCVLRKGSEVRTCRRRGVIDLCTLLREAPDYMRGASLADKVIGKGAAAVIATAGIAEVYADVMSQSALEVLRQARMQVSYGQLVSAIRNRQGDGLCPLETACAQAQTAAEAMPLVTAFVERMMAADTIK